MKRVAIYARVSTEEQTQGFSIAGQISELKNDAERRGDKVVKVYTDEGFTGKNMDRPDLNDLLKSLESREFDEVLVWRSDRLARNMKDFLTIIDLLHFNKAVLRSLKEGTDSSSLSGLLNLQIMGSIAQYNGGLIVETAKMGSNKRASNGFWNGNPPLGYKMVNKELVVVPEEASIVRLIFDTYISGKGVKSIVNLLNKSGYRTKKGNPFSIHGVCKILRNPLYCGQVLYGRLQNWNQSRRSGRNDNPIESNGRHERIITNEIWTLAQSIIESKSQPKPRNVLYYPLSGLIRCPQCGAPMVGYRQKRKRKHKVVTYRYYECGNYHNGGSAVCKSNLIPADDAEEAVFRKISGFLCSPQLVANVINQINQQRNQGRQQLSDAKQNIQKELSVIKTKLDRWLVNFENGNINSGTVLERISKLDSEKVALEQRLEEIAAQMRCEEVDLIPPEVIVDVLQKFDRLVKDADPEVLKELMRIVVVKILADSVTRKVEKVELRFDLSSRSHNIVKFNSNPKYELELQTHSKCLSLFMIRFTPINPEGPVKLLHQHQPHQLMRKGHLPKGQQKVRPLQNYPMQTQ